MEVVPQGDHVSMNRIILDPPDLDQSTWSANVAQARGAGSHEHYAIPLGVVKLLRNHHGAAREEHASVRIRKYVRKTPEVELWGSFPCELRFWPCSLRGPERTGT